ncbi:MAG: GH92 family glycosyl hydrolase [Ignavibacteria bacterium]|jgi:predicted alpha-1,2-mannosidase
MKNIIVKFTVYSFLLAANFLAQDLTKYVDPFIGTGGHGHTYPGVTVPFGMVQLSPDTRTGNWDACGGYHYTDNTIIGFSHQHLSGVGVLDYSDILFMPTVGEIKLNKGTEEDTKSGYRSKFDHTSETAGPGYYSVLLKDYDINVELTATTRAGFHKYTYPKNSDANLIIDLTHQLEPGERIKELELQIVNENTIRGMRRSAGWAEDQIVYFYAEFSKPIIDFGISENGSVAKNKKLVKGNDLKAFLRFTNNEKPLLIKVGISAVDYEGAKNNLKTEIPNWDFEKVRKEAKEKWNKQLSKIIVKDKSDEKKKIFYTALYHSSIIPNIFYDVDRRYRGNDRKIHLSEEFDNYTIFSLWDTFRATHPLFVLIEPTKTENMIKSMLIKYKESGLLPKWELAGNETGTMIGYHSVSVIADAYAKGIRGFDTELALEAMIATAKNNSIEMNLYDELSYLPSDKRIESVSKTLEYAYDDWCIYGFAESIGNKAVAAEFKERALNYINLFDGSTGFFRAKRSNGNWDSPFDPFEISRNYTEANAWQYSMFVPHDVKGLINLHGNENNLINHLDKLFTAEGELSGHDIPDVTGLIGQYVHGNEPSHHVAYLYNLVGQPWKTQERINQINKEMYTIKPGGLIGNEDCGQMSSWFNFSSLGLYPFCPGTDEYQIGSPYFEEAEINLENGKKIIIKTENLSEKNIYVQSLTLNGKKINGPFINHNDIANGGSLVFEMSSKPNKNWGVDNQSYSLTNNETTSIPYIKNDVGYFLNKISIDFACRTKEVKIYYTLDGSEPTKNSKLFNETFEIEKSVVIKARAYKDGFLPGPILKVNAVKAEFLKSIKTDKITPGIKFQYVEGKFSSAYDLKNTEVVKSGELGYFNLDRAEKEDYYGFIYTGYIEIPKDNIYTFYCKSDDGSILFINDKEIVNNDGSHSAIFASGSIALEKGIHPFTLLYFEDYEGNSIDVYWESSEIKKEKLPKSVLFR